ncbi:ATP-binding protein [Methanosphaerula subterraneus]|uniref:ATP-binding protein n=1 Tax=Methanosphaerula subterraneus TaxID=3350244 RepID=UPI003F838200
MPGLDLRPRSDAGMGASLMEQSNGKYLLKLYVSGATPQSARAIQNIRRIGEEHLAGRYTLEVIDISQHHELTRDEQIVMTPTLVRKEPAPVQRFVGDLSDSQKVLSGLGLLEGQSVHEQDGPGPSAEPWTSEPGELLRETEMNRAEIRTGEVDAIVVPTPDGDRIFTRTGAESPYRTLVEMMNEGMVTIDRAGAALYCNRRFASIVEAPMETIPGSRFNDWICFHDRLLYEALLVAGADVQCSGDLHLVSTRGKMVPVHLSLSPFAAEGITGICIVVTDLTTRIQNKALLRSEHLAHSILEQAADPIVVTDAEKVIIRANTAAVEMAGANPLLAPFDTAFPLFQVTGDGEVPFSPTRISCAGLRVKGMEVLFRRTDATLFSLLLSVAPVIGEPGEAPGCVVVMADITAQKQVEGELRRTLDDLAHSNQDLQQFAYIASHDLQEPLRMVASYLQLLERKYREQLDPDAQLFIGYAVEGANRMQQQINDLLAYSRVTSRGRPLRPGSAEEALATALRHLALKIEETGATITHDPLPMVRADLPQLVQVFSNLLDNALTFRNPQVAPEIHISAEDKAGWVVFSVQDNGIGIDPEFYQRIFQMFQRLHSRAEYPGTGIGLAICQRIIERHHGRIWVTSVPGSGSTFCFTIPSIIEHPNHRYDPCRG